MTRGRATLIGAGTLILCGLAILFWPQPTKESLSLQPLSFDEIPGWKDDTLAAALPALTHACEAKVAPLYCAALAQAKPRDETGVRVFFETQFTPYRVRAQSFVTGYYQALVKGSLTRGGAFQTPLWGEPKDLVRIDIGAFLPQEAGQVLYGRNDNGRIVPYETRAEMKPELMQKRAKPLVWLSDPLDAFFMEIQGSGLVKLPTGQTIALGYTAKNGAPYVAIGRVLRESGALLPPITAQSIQAWLRAHPERITEILNKNPSVTFFKRQPKGEAIGAQGVSLTPGRSLAVDPSFVAMGTPVWLATERRQTLTVAQDTGSAIKGAGRGDLFLGVGAAAEQDAGAMQEKGEMIVLLPRGTPLP